MNEFETQDRLKSLEREVRELRAQLSRPQSRLPIHHDERWIGFADQVAGNGETVDIYPVPSGELLGTPSSFKIRCVNWTGRLCFTNSYVVVFNERVIGSDSARYFALKATTNAPEEYDDFDAFTGPGGSFAFGGTLESTDGIDNLTISLTDPNDLLPNVLSGQYVIFSVEGVRDNIELTVLSVKASGTIGGGGGDYDPTAGLGIDPMLLASDEIALFDTDYNASLDQLYGGTAAGTMIWDTMAGWLETLTGFDAGEIQIPINYAGTIAWDVGLEITVKKTISSDIDEGDATFGMTSPTLVNGLITPSSITVNATPPIYAKSGDVVYARFDNGAWTTGDGGNFFHHLRGIGLYDDGDTLQFVVTEDGEEPKWITPDNYASGEQVIAHNNGALKCIDLDVIVIDLT